VRQEDFAKFKIAESEFKLREWADSLGFKRGRYPNLWYAYNPVLQLNALDYNFAKYNNCVQNLQNHKIVF